MISGGDRDIRSVTGGAGAPPEDLPASTHPDAAGEEPVDPRLAVLGYAEALVFRQGHVSAEGRSSWFLLKLFSNLGVQQSIVLRDDEASIRRVLNYILRKYLDDDPNKIVHSNSFVYRPNFILPNGTVTTGQAIINAYARFKYPGMTAENAVEALGGESEILRILRQEFVFVWSETPNGLSRAMRYIVEQDMHGDASELFSPDFGSRTFSFPHKRDVKGEGFIEAGKWIFGWHDVADEEVLRRLYDKAFIVLQDDKSSVQRVFNYVLHKYLNGDSDRITTGVFAGSNYVLPNGSKITGQLIINAYAKSIHPELDVRDAIRALGGASEICRILRDELVATWSTSSNGLSRALRYIVQQDLNGDSSLIFDSEFRSRVFSFPDGTHVNGEQFIEAERQSFSLEELTDDEVLQRIHDRTFIVLKDDETSIRRVLNYVLRQYFDDDPARILTVSEFLEPDSHFVLPNGTKVTGLAIINAYARSKFPAMLTNDAVKAAGGLAEICRILRENFVNAWSETPNGLSRALKYIVERDFAGDSTQMFNSNFRSMEFSFPNGPMINGESFVEAGKRVLSLPDATDREVMQALHDRTFITLQDDVTSVRRVLNYALRQYLEDDPARIVYSPLFFDANFILPNGKKITGKMIVYAYARSRFPGMSGEKAIESLGGQREVCRILREQLVSTWSETPNGLSRALRYVVEHVLSGDVSQLFNPNFKSRVFSFPDGTTVRGEQFVDVGRRVFLLGEATDRKVLQTLHDRAFVVLQDDLASVRSVLNYVLRTHVNDDLHRILYAPSFLRPPSGFILPDGTKTSGVAIIGAYARSRHPGMRTADAIKAAGGIGEIVRFLREELVNIWSETPNGLSRAMRYVVEHYLNGDDSIVFHSDFRSRVFSFPGGIAVKGDQFIGVGREAFLLPDASDTDILQAIYNKAFVVLQDNERSVLNVLNYILRQYLNDDLERIRNAPSFRQPHFILPDGSEIRARMIINAYARSKYAGMSSVDAVKAMGGESEILRILKEKLAFTWSDTPMGMSRLVRYVVENHLNGDTSRLFDPSFESGIFSFPNGTTVSGKEFIDAGRHAFSMEEATDEEVLQRMYEAAFVVLQDDEDSIRRVLTYIFHKYLGDDHQSFAKSNEFLGKEFAMPNGKPLTFNMILSAIRRVEYPDASQAQISVSILLQLAIEKYLGLTSPDLSKIGELPGIEAVRSPADILMLVHTLLPDSKRASPEDIFAAYRALNLGEAGIEPPEPTPDSDLPVPGPTDVLPEPGPQIFIEAFSPDVSVSGEQIVRLADIYINLLYQEFSGSPDDVIPYLERLIAENDNPTRAMFYNYAMTHFKKIQKITVRNIKTTLRPYQREAIKFLRERNGALLADEPGMGKTVEILAATQSVRARRVLILTHPRVVSTWNEEIEKHFEDVPGHIVLGSGAKRRFANREANSKFFERLNSATYIIVNYEALREKKGFEGTNPLLAYLKSEADIDTIVVDEFQNVDNPHEENQQAEAARQLNARRRWIVSASPYQSKIENLFVALSYIAPDIFIPEKDNGTESAVPEKPENVAKQAFKPVTLKAFRKLVKARDEDSLRTLNALLNQYMIRRIKSQALGTADRAQPLETQRGRLPEMVYVPYRDEGAYQLTEDHARLMAEMINNFKGWAERYNAWARKYNKALRKSGGDPKEERTEVDLENLNPLSKLVWLKEAMADPEYFGLGANETFHEKLDELIGKYVAQGKKVILFANYTRVIDSLWKRYFHRYGAVRMDGTVTSQEQEESRRKFNVDGLYRLMVANPRSGGVGINLPAADAIIYIGQPQTYVWRYQSEHRANRADPNYVKAEVRLIDMVGQYPQAFLDQLSEKERKFLDVGTVAEIEYRILSRRRMEFEVVMNGVPSHREFERSIEHSITGALGWSDSDDTTEDLTLEDLVEENQGGENNGNGSDNGNGGSSIPPPPQSTPPPAPETPPTPSDSSAAGVTVSGLDETSEALPVEIGSLMETGEEPVHFDVQTAAARTYAGGVRHGINTQLLSARTFMTSARALPMHAMPLMRFATAL